MFKLTTTDTQGNVHVYNITKEHAFFFNEGKFLIKFNGEIQNLSVVKISLEKVVN